MLTVSRFETKITCDSDHKCTSRPIRSIDPIEARREASRRQWVEKLDDECGHKWYCDACKRKK